MLAAENLQLVAEHQDLDLLGRSAAEPQRDQGEHSAKGEVHERRQGQHSSRFEGERARRLPGRPRANGAIENVTRSIALELTGTGVRVV